MLIISPYETVACKDYVIRNVEVAIERFLATGVFKTLEDSPNVLYLDASSSEYAVDIPSWGHPLVLNDKVYIDVRNHTKLDMRTRQVVMTNPSEFKFAASRAKLTLALLKGGATHLQTFTSLPITVFSAWLSEQIARRFNLDHATQYRLSILCGMYYQSLFIGKDTPYDETYIQQSVLSLTRTMSVKSEDVFALYDRLDTGFSDVRDFCNKLAHVMDNVRLESFNHALLYTLIGGTWVGFNSREVAAVALEHVPTFLAMVELATVDRGFNYASFTKLVQRKGKRELEDFTQRINSIYLSHS